MRNPGAVHPIRPSRISGDSAVGPLRLVAHQGTGPEGATNWDGRGHFFAAAAEAMRRILVENARRKAALKAGGGRERVDLAGAAPAEDLLALDEALELLARQDPGAAQLVQLRYFAGLTIPEAAEALGISSTTADRYWAYARAWLHAELSKGPPGRDG